VQVIGTSERRPTLLFNGYGDTYADLYKDLRANACGRDWDRGRLARFPLPTVIPRRWLLPASPESRTTDGVIDPACHRTAPE